jgi:hypothetical protein
LVDAAAADTEFGARASVLVSAGQHTVRVYPMSGTLAIDAFGLEAVTIEPTVEPTLPAIEPTAEPTQPPVEPTADPTPLPVLIPFADAFDGGLGWTSSGAWRLDAAHQRMGWFADSTLRDQASSLTFGTLIDLRGTATP